MSTPRIRFASQITLNHGTRFVEEWGKRLTSDYSFFDAVDMLDIMRWPGEDPSGSLAEEDRYHALSEEILRRMLQIAHGCIAEAFRAAASEVIDRERAQRRKARRG